MPSRIPFAAVLLSAVMIYLSANSGLAFGMPAHTPASERQPETPRFESGLSVTHVCVDRQGRRALLGCVSSALSDPESPYDKREIFQHQLFDKLLLIDLDSMSQLAERTLEHPAKTMCLTIDGVYIGQHEEGIVRRLSILDLSDTHTVQTEEPPLTLVALDNTRLFVSQGYASTNPVMALSVNDFSRDQFPGKNGQFKTDYRSLRGH